MTHKVLRKGIQKYISKHYFNHNRETIGTDKEGKPMRGDRFNQGEKTEGL